MSEFLYSANHTVTDKPSNNDFCLHNHKEHEIFVFLEGDSKYVVEEKSYNLSPGDIIIIRKQEMHRIFHNSEKQYKRIFLMLSHDFFTHYNCEEYENSFFANDLKLGNKINSKIVHSSGLYDAIMRLGKYSDDFTNLYTPISNSIMIEILHIINHISLFEVAETSNETIKDIIDHINKHFKEEIKIGMLCNKFFISKYYLCRVFKEATGLTIHEYIDQKRLTYAEELRISGMSLTDAALSAGYSSYSSFYRAFVKKHNSSPSGR